MEHEVFVPVPAERLREVLDDPARVARVVPGLQQDAGAEPVTGRLKIRVGSHSVTYRGAVRVSRRDDGAYAVEGEAEESRGSGSVKLALRIALREAEDGCTVVFDGTASADGRIKDLPADAVESAVARLLNRFAEHLADAAPNTTTSLATQDFEPRATTDHETTPDADDEPVPPAGADESSTPAPDDEPPAPAPDDQPPAPEPPVGRSAEGAEGDEDAESIAEAAHARRTMIGRSAEEVDHAPPRGRYAPVPAPQTVSPPAPLRWAAPAAALAVASAIVAVRALRRRR
ncbi:MULTISPECIES: SRPBCC domain-containing protein [Streptomyces]|uniref:SRPBCC family protein n=1 Tax=Streptomyces koelreuteriae TaxID=2838015 RepID=A0ABX8FSS6_9ACTN|nr:MULTISPECIES: SRPBCC domain-containing protein [Streptomyces]QWB24146.1 SRPBCC family protein [Streptomyces koelreuteriae]UUA07134.1 SRPBCC domain-containing protein [Streptomyces koelreuteriae]UUA14763.1 SRPBCC domain-containing protein [Streptomyces sp. CRCS-T-1]